MNVRYRHIAVLQDSAKRTVNVEVRDSRSAKHGGTNKRSLLAVTLDCSVRHLLLVPHGTKPSMRERNSALRVVFRYASNPFVARCQCLLFHLSTPLIDLCL